MGLYVHSLSRLPLGMERDYYVYVLDYGWDEPLTQALHANFRRMADLAAKSDAIVVAGTDSRAFAQEVLSVHVDEPNFRWDNINGEPGEDILPALARAADAAGQAFRAGALSHLEWAQLQSDIVEARHQQLAAAVAASQALIEIQRLTAQPFVLPTAALPEVSP